MVAHQTEALVVRCGPNASRRPLAAARVMIGEPGERAAPDWCEPT